MTADCANLGQDFQDDCISTLLFPSAAGSDALILHNALPVEHVGHDEPWRSVRSSDDDDVLFVNACKILLLPLLSLTSHL